MTPSIALTCHLLAGKDVKVEILQKFRTLLRQVEFDDAAEVFVYMEREYIPVAAHFFLCPLRRINVEDAACVCVCL